MSITYEHVSVALVFQQAMFMRQVVVACPALRHFSTSHKRDGFKKIY